MFSLDGWKLFGFVFKKTHVSISVNIAPIEFDPTEPLIHENKKKSAEEKAHLESVSYFYVT